jgi:hypothetical protein
MSINKKRGSIALARSLCYQINGAADDSDDMDGGGYGSVDVAEILSAEIERLREALAQPEHEPTCPKCTAVVLYECVACSNNNYPPKPEQEPSQWREMVVVTLVREGINKHKARELADHFAAQRPWQGLTPEEVQFYALKHSKLVNAGYDKATDTNFFAKTFDSTGFYKEVSTVLRERNNG